MKGKHKKFERGLYNKYDAVAKKAVQVHLEIAGHHVTVPPENYGPDLYSELAFRRTYHEVEVSQLWKMGDFPFPTGSIPERKYRLLSKIEDCELFYWMLRLDTARAVVFPHIVINDKWLVEVPNKKIKSGEYFFRPPLIYGKEFDLARFRNGYNHSTL